MTHVWRRHRALRQAVVTQAFLSVGFSAFWSSLAILLSQEFHLGSAVAGAFGLAGAAGAAAAPLAGRVADRRGPELAARLGCALAALSFASLAGGALLPANGRLAVLALSAIGFDFGIQSSLVAHQTIVYSVEPAARSRSNAILFTGMFAGMAAGSTLGSLAVAQWGWTGITVVSTAAALCALLVRFSQTRIAHAVSCNHAAPIAGETNLCGQNTLGQS
jgi:predicted MFS family arabinose efflux permease